MNLVLSSAAVRVLGCLVEKQMSTPDTYPLTLNALVAACNQKSNRDPVVQMDETEVVRAVDELRYEHQLAHQVTAAGSRVMKYEHDLLRRWSFLPTECAVLCELFLRGPQTAGELRTHTPRLCNFDSPAEVTAAMEGLTSWPDGPFVVLLPREPGCREPRWMHCFSGATPPDPATLPVANRELPPEPARLRVDAADARIDALEKQVQALQAAVAALQTEFQSFRHQFE